MSPRSHRTHLAAIMTLAVVSLAPVATAHADPESEDCGVADSGVLTIEQLPEGSPAEACDLVGRDITHGGVTVEIPEPGFGVVGENMFPTGSEEFEVLVTEDGHIQYAVDDSIGGPEVGEEPGAAARVPVECTQSNNTYNGEYVDSLNVYVGDGSFPAGLSLAGFGVVANIAMETLETGGNDCGFRDKITRLTLTYKGQTTKESDFVISGGVSGCGPRDGTSTIDAGNLDKGGNPQVASSCRWFAATGTPKRTLESDIRFNIQDFDFTTAPRAAGCAAKGYYDVESVMVHELGHSVGMGHVSESIAPSMTMSTQSSRCNASARTLGKGDLLMLQYMYCLNSRCQIAE